MNKFNLFFALSIVTALLVGLITPLSADYMSPKKQLESGVLPEDVVCNGSKVLVMRDNGKIACVTESTADKKGWEIIKHMKNEVNPTQLNELPTAQQQKTFVDYGTATASFSNNATLAKISNFCSDWPKNFSVQFPNAVLIGENFDIHIHYANIIYDDEDILESKQTGETLSPQDAEDKLENARESCFDTFVYFGLNEKISLITPHVIDEPTLNADTQRTTNYHHIEYPFNNTEEQVQIVTMRFDSLPDRYDGNMLIGTQGSKIKINHFVDDNGVIFLDTPSTNNVNVAFSAVSPFAAMTDEQKTSSNFYTQEILLPEKALCEQFVCDENGVPVGNTEETLPPMERFAEYIKANVAPEDVISWLQNEEKLTPEYIKEILETYFPDLVAQFILFLGFDIPSAYAAPFDQVFLHGTASYTTDISDPNAKILFNGVKICAFDRDESTGEDVQLFNGQTPICDITSTSGNFALTPFKDDPNDTDFIDVVLYVYPSNDYFNFVKNKHPTNPQDEEIITRGFEFLHMPIDEGNFEDYTFTLIDDNTEIFRSIKTFHVMEESKNFIKNTYNFDPRQVTVDFNTLGCNDIIGVFYDPYTFAPEKVIYLDDEKKFPLCNAREMFESDTPKHEYYHFYTDLIYTEKNNGNLPDDSEWGNHTPDINIPIEQAWIEGIATGLVLLEKDFHLYKPVGNIFDFDYEEGFGIGQGDRDRIDWAEGPDSEGAVTTFIYDLIDDTPNEIGDHPDKTDTINLSASQVNNVFDDRLSGESIVASTVLDFISDWEDETGYPDIDNVAFLNAIIPHIDDHAPKDPFKGSLIFEDDFHTDLSKWVLSGDEDWEIGQYSFSQPPFADSIVYDVATIDNCDDYCIMTMDGSLDLGNYEQLYLNFWYFVDEHVDDSEGLKVEISLNNGSTWDEIFYWNESKGGNTHTWTEIRNHDISQYAGYSFNLRLTAISSASSEDVMLANLQVRGVQGSSGGGSTNYPLVLHPIDNITIAEGASETVQVSASDSNGDAITYSLSNPLSFASILGNEITMFPTDDDGGLYTIDVVATAAGQTDTKSFTVTVQNTIEHADSSTGSGTAIFSSDVGQFGALSAVDPLRLPTQGRPVASFPHGLFAFDIEGLALGQTVTISVKYPDNIPSDSQYWKVIDGMWTDATSLLGSNDGDDIITISITDGGLGDADGAENGSIIDLGGIAVPATIPRSPTDLSLIVQSSTEIDLLWSAPSDDGGSTITGYVIERNLNESEWQVLVSDTESVSTAYSDTALQPGDTASYRISAINQIGPSLPSSIATVTASDTVPPVITLNGDNPQTIKLGSGYVELGATTDDSSPLTIDPSSFVDKIGTYNIYYDSIDSSGNQAIQVIRTVNVVNITNDDCIPPQSGDWIITQDCTMNASANVPANIIVQDNSILTIPDGITLDVDLENHYIIVKHGSSIIIRHGGIIS